jgi:hypothetical protein
MKGHCYPECFTSPYGIDRSLALYRQSSVRGCERVCSAFRYLEQRCGRQKDGGVCRPVVGAGYGPYMRWVYEVQWRSKVFSAFGDSRCVAWS